MRLGDVARPGGLVRTMQQEPSACRRRERHAHAGEGSLPSVDRPHGDAPPVRLTLTIEEPAPGALFLRFVYTADGFASAEDTALQGYREQAWLENDRDMLRSLRTWHADGEL